jgi:hypothetical protein
MRSHSSTTLLIVVGPVKHASNHASLLARGRRFESAAAVVGSCRARESTTVALRITTRRVTKRAWFREVTEPSLCSVTDRAKHHNTKTGSIS